MGHTILYTGATARLQPLVLFLQADSLSALDSLWLVGVTVHKLALLVCSM